MNPETAAYLAQIKAELREIDGTSKPLTPEWEPSLRVWEAKDRARLEKAIAEIEADDGAKWEAEADASTKKMNDIMDAIATDDAKRPDQ